MNLCRVSSLVILSLVLISSLSSFSAAEDVVLQQIKKDGYVPSLHKVKTPDGYFLRVLRISGQENASPRGTVFMMHCLMCSAGIYISAGYNQSLAYNFVRQGYDVWLGNIRGTRFSQKHVRYNKHQDEFWDFDLTDLGSVDVPTMVNFVLKTTKSRQLHYVGHSMGGALFMIMMATRPEMAAKIRSVYLMAPAMYVGRSFSELVNMGYALYPGLLKHIFRIFNYRYFPVDPKLIKSLTQDLRQYPFLNFWSEIIWYNIMGSDSAQTDPNKLLQHSLLGFDTMSTRMIEHFNQFYGTGQFKAYDYGPRINRQKYGTLNAPKFNLTRLPKRIVTFFGTGDALVTYENSKTFLKRVRVTKNYYLKRYNHFDLQFGRSIKEHIFDRIMKFIDF